jgi:pimeloyl-ACP methyl ester carboxylesterase
MMLIKLAATAYVLIMTMTAGSQAQNIGKYADVNGIRMYYEVHGSGEPLVLIHGGGSTIDTSFGRVLPLFAKTRKVIVMERQAHGRTPDRNAPATFEQDADDIAELLKQLKIKQADILGFSNGGHTAIELALRHPTLVRKLILASTNINRDGMPPEFWKGMENPKFSDMPQVYKDAFLKVNNDQAALMKMFERDSSRMKVFKGWTDAQIRSIKHPVLIVTADRDVILPEHAVHMHRFFPKSRLMILPGTHGSYMGEVMTPVEERVSERFVEMIGTFLIDQDK